MTTQTLYPVANSVPPTQVRETDDAYIIEDVPFIRPMRLAGGYVPEQSVRETSAQWDGVPATLNHPRDDAGRPVAANEQPETHIGTTEEPYYDGTHVRGNIRLEKAELQDGGEASDIEAALEAGEPIEVSSQYASVDLPPGKYDGEHRQNAERIVRPDSVAILPNRTGVCSIEDGCGINPQLAANAAVTVPMTRSETGEGQPTDNSFTMNAQFSEGDLVSWSWSGDTAYGRVADVFVDEGTVSRTIEGTEVSKDSDDAPVYLIEVWRGLADDADGEGEFSGEALRKEGNRELSAWEDPPESAMSANVDVPEEYRFGNPGEAVEAAQELGFEGAGDEVIHTHESGGGTVFMPGPSHEELVATLREEGIIEMDAAGDYGDKPSANAAFNALRTLWSALGGGQADDGVTPEDLAVTPTTANAADDVDRDALIDDIVANSPLTEAALAERCNDGLEAIHADVMDAPQSTATDEGADPSANSTDTDTDDSDTDTMSDNPDDKIGLDDLTDEAADELVSRAEARIQANREDEQKEELATEIIANSANYDSDDRETLVETPLDVLKDLKAKATGGTSGVPAGGLSGNASVADGAESTEDYPDGVLN
jgi:hypothetical protein